MVSKKKILLGIFILFVLILLFAASKSSNIYYTNEEITIGDGGNVIKVLIEGMERKTVKTMGGDMKDQLIVHYSIEGEGYKVRSFPQPIFGVKDIYGEKMRTSGMHYVGKDTYFNFKIAELGMDAEDIPLKQGEKKRVRGEYDLIDLDKIEKGYIIIQYQDENYQIIVKKQEILEAPTVTE